MSAEWTNWLGEAFVWRAWLAGLCTAAVAGALGCFVLWRRMAYFGDSMAHGALLGVAAGMLGGFHPHTGVLITCILFATLLTWLRHKKFLTTDALLGILAHAALALGVAAVYYSGRALDLHAYLFGDILFIDNGDLLRIMIGGVVVLVVLATCWKSLVLLSIHEDLAASEGIKPLRTNMILMLLIAIVTAASIRAVGVLLIGALLLIPAATARPFARSPAHMAWIAALFGMAAVTAGLALSLYLDIPTGPAIVIVAAALFALLLPFALRR